MQTDSPTGKHIKERSKGGVREMFMPGMTGLEEKMLPRTRDPEFATPIAKKNKKINQDRERKQRERKGKTEERPFKKATLQEKVTQDAGTQSIGRNAGAVCREK